MPTQQRLRALFDYNEETGQLTSRIKRGKLHVGSPAGSITGTGHVLCGLGNRQYQLAHRIIWMLVHGSIPKGIEIDHINGNAADNRLVNLRAVTHAENLHNQKRRTDNTSGTSGVYYRAPQNRWVVYIRSNNVKYWVGSFATQEEAISARKQAERVHNFHPNHGRVVQSKAA